MKINTRLTRPARIKVSRSILRNVEQIEGDQKHFKEQLIQHGTGASLTYFDAILAIKYDNPKAPQRRLRRVFEAFSLLYVRVL